VVAVEGASEKLSLYDLVVKDDYFNLKPNQPYRTKLELL